MRILGIETTCDETGAAVVEDGARILSNIVLDQIPLHERFGGVVPEIASRAHVQVVTRIIERALARAGIDPASEPPVDAVAVANRPGLVGSLLVGLAAAKSLALAWDVPLVAVDHVHAHIYASCLERPGQGESGSDDAGSAGSVFPALSLVISGGHTSLYRSEGWTRHVLLGNTLDDAVGEAFDKAAAILGLGYPGGPAISRAASGGNRRAVKLPRTLLDSDSLDFSFSGIKTAVLYHVKGQDGRRASPNREDVEIADVAASFESAVADVLIEKIRRGLSRERLDRVIVGGGVAANRHLRERLDELRSAEGIDVRIPPFELCTDNGAMIAGLGFRLLEEGSTSDLSLEVQPLTT